MQYTTPSNFTITYDGSCKASELVKIGRYKWSNGWITDEHFPIQPHPPVQRQVELVEFDHGPTLKEVLADFNRRGLKRPTYEDALYFGSQHKGEQRKNPIVFLHKFVPAPHGILYVLVLGCGNAGDRYLDLGWYGTRWGRRDRFAGVRESMPADR